MTDTILIFTFSPIQSFISEARRAADLYAGSQILVELAKASAESIGWEHIIYPANKQDIPNRIVASVPVDEVFSIAEKAKSALLKRWLEIADSALKGTYPVIEGIEEKEKKNPFYRYIPQSTDVVWKNIWDRQTADDYLWEIFWAAVEQKDGSAKAYRDAYETAELHLQAVKFSRSFKQTLEPGFKDTLSGKREALHSKDKYGRQFWMDISGEDSSIAPIQIRPNGRERLDAIGLVKRFSDIAHRKRVPPFNHFPSTSSIASADFLETIDERLPELKTYQKAVEAVFMNDKYKVRTGKWQYDGDLFYTEILTFQRMKNDYGIEADKDLLKTAQGALNALTSKVEAKPSPYYGIIALDGDDMGEHIKACTNADEHRQFSDRIAVFAGEVKTIADKHYGAVIYNGGDDVLAMAPLATVYKMAKELADIFHEKVRGTVSAGIAITHHQSPLSAALEAVRGAGKNAKRIPGKSAVCVRLLKRSGGPVEMVGKWDDEEGLFSLSVEYFKTDGGLSSKFAYDVIEEAYAGSALPSEARLALLKRLIKRHKTNKLPEPDLFTEHLHNWAKLLDACAPKLKDNAGEVPQGMAEIGKWLSFAHFVAQGGGE